ncbi:roadblock/LC7 domain-containing protein [bacterium]|nr:MAG: roadblock/LC7 domain-containing protein [bacterium]
MSFSDILRGLVTGVKGGAGAAIMGVDGLAIEKFQLAGSAFDVDTIGVEYGRVIEEVKNAAMVLSLGALEEIVVTMPGAEVFLRVITPDYYLVLVLKSVENAGKARYLLRRAALRAKLELAV